MFANVPRKYARFILLPFAIALLGIFFVACSEDAEPTAIVLPTATPGTMSVTVTPTIYQDEDDKKVQVGFNLGLQDYSQQGAGVVRQLDRGTWIKVTVRPAPGTIQQISIRRGRCENATDLPNFQWVETLDPAIGGVSETTLTERHVSTILDGNHAIAVSIPGGTFSQVATCGDLPDLSHLELPPSVDG